jgi:hypothetical protein
MKYGNLLAALGKRRPNPSEFIIPLQYVNKESGKTKKVKLEYIGAGAYSIAYLGSDDHVYLVSVDPSKALMSQIHHRSVHFPELEHVGYVDGVEVPDKGWGEAFGYGVPKRRSSSEFVQHRNIIIPFVYPLPIYRSPFYGELMEIGEVYGRDFHNLWWEVYMGRDLSPRLAKKFKSTVWADLLIRAGWEAESGDAPWLGNPGESSVEWMLTDIKRQKKGDRLTKSDLKGIIKEGWKLSYPSLRKALLLLETAARQSGIEWTDWDFGTVNMKMDEQGNLILLDVLNPAGPTMETYLEMTAEYESNRAALEEEKKAGDADDELLEPLQQEVDSSKRVLKSIAEEADPRRYS